jgi:hypothetical protein
MQGVKCMKMHKNKRTNKSNKGGFFRAVTQHMFYSDGNHPGIQAHMTRCMSHTTPLTPPNGSGAEDLVTA